MAEGVVDDVSYEGLRALLREECVTFQRIKTWKTSKDPRYAEKKARVEHLYGLADREAVPAPATLRWCSASTSSARSACNRAAGGSGPRSAGIMPSPAARRGPGCARPTPALNACGTY